MPKIIQITAVSGSVANSPRLYALTDEGAVLENRPTVSEEWEDITPRDLRAETPKKENP